MRTIQNWRHQYSQRIMRKRLWKDILRICVAIETGRFVIQKHPSDTLDNWLQFCKLCFIPFLNDIDYDAKILVATTVPDSDSDPVRTRYLLGWKHKWETDPQPPLFIRNAFRGDKEQNEFDRLVMTCGSCGESPNSTQASLESVEEHRT